MKTKLLPTLLVATGLTAVHYSAALAKEGGSVGNGGNAKICFNGHPEIPKRLTTGISGIVAKMIPDADLPYISSVETLDLSDAKRPRGVERTTPELIDMHSGEKPWAFAKRIAQQFDLLPLIPRTDRTLSKILQGGIDAIGDRIYFSPESRVFPVDDIRPLEAAGDSCVYATVAVQREIGNGKREIVIDGRLYDRMGEDLSRAMLFTHEFYLSAFADSIKASGNTEALREFTAALIQKDGSLGTLIEIINRRDLWGNGLLKHYREVGAQPIMTVMDQIADEYAKAWFTLTKDPSLAGELYSKTAPLYDQLPRWFKEKHGMMTLDRNTVHYSEFRTCFPRRNPSSPAREFKCLGERDEKIVSRIHEIQAEFMKSRFYPELHTRLATTHSSREQRFDAALTALGATRVVNPDAILEIKSALDTVVKSGQPENLEADGEFSKIYIRLDKTIYPYWTPSYGVGLKAPKIPLVMQ